MAWRLRSRPCLALPPALSPSTMNSSLSAAVTAGAVGEFAREIQSAAGGGLAADARAGGPARLAGAGGDDDAIDDRLGDRAIVVQPLLEHRAHRRVHHRLHFGVVQPVLGLALELRVFDEDAEHADHAFADVFGRQRDAARRKIVGFDIVADRLENPGAQAVFVRAAAGGGNAVDVALAAISSVLSVQAKHISMRMPFCFSSMNGCS